MQVARREITRKVVRRPRPAEVDMGDEAELAERVQGPVDGGAVDARAQLLGPLADLLGAQVLLGPREHLDHGEPGRRDPLAPLPEPLRTDLDRTRHLRTIS